MSTTTLTDLLRAQLLTSWINLCLYSLELALLFIYFYQFPKDKLYIRGTVISLLLASTASTISFCSTVWLATITHPNVPALWPRVVVTVAIVVTGTLERSFLIHRIFSLSHSKIICGFLTMLVITQASLCLFASIETVVRPMFMRGPGSTATTVSSSIAVFVDICIPALLIFQLRKLNAVLNSTKNIIRRITILAISSGIVVGAVSIAFMALYVVRSCYYLIVASILGRFYSLTVLTNLIGRSRNPNAPAFATAMDRRISDLNFGAGPPTSRGQESTTRDPEFVLPVNPLTSSPRHFKNDA